MNQKEYRDKKLQYMDNQNIYDIAIANQMVEEIIEKAILENPFKTEWEVHYQGCLILVVKTGNGFVATHNLAGKEVRHGFTI